MDENRIAELEKKVVALQESLDKTDKIVKKLHSSYVRGRIFKLAYLALIVVVGIIFYVFMAPYYSNLLNMYNVGSEQKDGMQDLINQAKNGELSDLINSIQQ